jgi:flagellar hook-basal body complex protein FliE
MAIGSISSIAAALPALTTPAAPAVTSAPMPGGEGSFANSVGGALEKLEAAQQKADGLAQQVATGQLRDVHDFMIASTEASVATELTLAVRNKVVEAFNQIMQMPV